MITNLTALKRVLLPGARVTLVARSRAPWPDGFDATGIARRVVAAQSNAVAFEPVAPGAERPSWLRWPKASEVSFSIEEPGGAQLFTVNGLTYRIESGARYGR